MKHQAQIASLVHSIKYYRSNYIHFLQYPSENNAEGLFLTYSMKSVLL